MEQTCPHLPGKHLKCSKGPCVASLSCSVLQGGRLQREAGRTQAARVLAPTPCWHLSLVAGFCTYPRLPPKVL